METTTQDEDERTLLRGVGLRVTRPRLAVLTALADQPQADASTVLAAVRRALPGTSHQAVYDCLHALTEAGLVRSLQPAGSPARYEICTGDNHHHLVCRGCGTVVDVPCRTGSAPCLDAPEDHGFAVDEAEVYYWGLCAGCRE
ncbi:Fur family transcriptional regulator [Micrococcus luteus]|uniref:Fur family transcriptional regulator n=1 Tax=Micrococcus luteus TaxID=1270 RepID=UPI00130312AF|nr:Fur family transcriptional regulator [Micrococcus luteus]QGY91340.1 transcriptional repressor [Micrococcus luteus]